MKTWDKALTLSLLAYFITCCPGFLSNKGIFRGRLEPIDPNVCPTQNITFTSVLLQSPMTNYSIGFAVKTRETNSSYEAVNYDRITEVNETMSHFTMYSTLKPEGASKDVFVHVRSYYWQELGDTDTKLQLGETSIVHILPLPEKVKYVKCIVINYVSMNCTWNYGKDYGAYMPEVAFQWRIPSYTASWTDCSDLSVDSGYCFWKSSEVGYFQNENITIRITLKQKCGMNATSEFHIDTERIVKPNPVSRLSSTAINSTCIQLFWDTTDSEPQHPKEHRIIVSSEWGNTTTMFNITHATENLPHSRTFCNLHPYTEYTFSVSIQPIGKYSGYFSDPRNSKTRTYSDIPGASPEVTEGGYNLNYRDCDGDGQKRRVCIFWKPIKKEHKNGPMKGIQGLFTSTVDQVSYIHEDWAEDSTYGCSNLLCNTSYNFTLKARNVNGTSEGGSTIKVPTFNPGNKPPDVIVESDNSSDVYIRWDNRENHNGFIVAWCRNRDGDCDSGHGVDWKHFPSNTTEAVLKINASAQDFLYGVSVLREDGSSGVDWQDCVYQKNMKPKREPKNVAVSAGSEDNSLLVTWDKRPCGSNEPYITMYIVQYYNSNDRNKKTTNVTGSGEARMLLKNLEEDQNYVVTVRGVTEDGQYGPESQPKTGKPMDKSSNSPVIAGILAAVVLAFVIFGILYCLWRYKYRAKKRTGNIIIPDAPDEESHIALLCHNSNVKFNKKANLPDDYRQATLNDDETITDRGETTTISGETRTDICDATITSGETRTDSGESTIDSGETRTDSGEATITCGGTTRTNHDETTVGNGENKGSETEICGLEPVPTRLNSDQQELSLLQTFTSEGTRESNLRIVMPEIHALPEISESGIRYSSEENNGTTAFADINVEYVRGSAETFPEIHESDISCSSEENNDTAFLNENIVEEYVGGLANTFPEMPESEITCSSQVNNDTTVPCADISVENVRGSSNAFPEMSESEISYSSEENNDTTAPCADIVEKYVRSSANAFPETSESDISYSSEENNDTTAPRADIVVEYVQRSSDAFPETSESGISYSSEENNDTTAPCAYIVVEYVQRSSDAFPETSESGISYSSEENNDTTAIHADIIVEYARYHESNPELHSTPTS